MATTATCARHAHGCTPLSISASRAIVVSLPVFAGMLLCLVGRPDSRALWPPLEGDLETRRADAEKEEEEVLKDK